MNFLIFLFLFLPKAFAQDSYSLDCGTIPQSTSVSLSQLGDEFLLKIVHHNGVNFAPSFRGMVTGHNLPKVMELTDSIKSLGDAYEFSFKKENCKIISRQIISCNYGSEKMINGKLVRAFAFDTQLSTSESYVGSYKTNIVNTMLLIDGKTQYLEFEFPEGVCLFSCPFCR